MNRSMGEFMPIPGGSKGGPVKRTLLRDTVFQRLREAILDGTLQPGERLNDDEIQKWLGVSRTPVRDALNELSHVGLVEMSPNRYTRVAVPREEEALAALQTLGVIMGGVVRLAVPRLDDGARKKVIKQAKVVVAHLRADDGESTNDAAVKLWRSLMSECGNPLLLSLCEQTIDGLAFKLRVATIDKLFDFDAHADMFEEFIQKIEANDAIGAELVVELIHLLQASNEDSVSS
ncbi:MULTISPECIES: GntR family transcriptional regulator [Micrococcaceae]|uniref:GntR family transcriptional regulator n=1 Tax=unclassified Kocuria TaxID=2649579 RepID=UPI001EDD3CBE|nr:MULTISPECIES: GntR family transcriptional regulator [unclassified Kocuria]